MKITRIQQEREEQMFVEIDETKNVEQIENLLVLINVDWKIDVK